MAQTEFPSNVVRDHGTFIDALRAAKDHRQISNETAEAIAGMSAGHLDKLFSGEKRVGPLTFGLLCEALGVEFVMRENPAATQRMAHRWEKRNASQVHVSQRVVSQATLDRCKPIILSQIAHKGWATRQAQRKHNGNGHAAR
jgi:hypothetical protein